jgi:hypothetical protein
MASFDWKSLPRLILMKTIGALLAVFFLALALLFLGYSVSTVLVTTRGQEAKVLSISKQVGKHQTAFRLGGLFQVTAEREKKKFQKIYCFYPAWPDVFQPTLGDVIQVWPAKQPILGGPVTDGWGWFIVGTLLILGLVMLEFAFLVLTIH